MPTITRPAPSPTTRREPTQGIARVVDVVDTPQETLLLDVVDGPAARAASCALVPSPGDTVWFVRDGDDCFVTAVLRRAQDQDPARWEHRGDLQIAATGRLHVSGRDVAVDADDEVSVHGRGLKLRFATAKAFLGEVSSFAKQAVHHVAQTRVVGQVLEHVVDRFVSHSRTSLRTVSELDQLSARDLDHRATSTATVSAKHTFVQGRDIVKADGDQIHIG